MIPLVERVQFISALRSRPFALLWIGQTISVLGNGAFTIALAWEVLLLTRSATAMGVVILAQTIPMLLFLLIGGVASDFLPRRLLMLWSDAGRAVILILIVGLSWFHLLQLWHLVTLSFCFGFIKCFFDPAYQAIRPQLVESDNLSSANSLTALSRQLGSMLGPLLGAGGIALVGIAGTFAFDGLTFIFSAFCLFAIRVPLAPSPQSAFHYKKPKDVFKLRTSFSLGQGARRMIVEVLEGLRYVRSSRWLWISIIVASIGNIGYAASLTVALPKLVHDVYGAGAWLLGVISTVNAIGAIIATIVITQLNRFRKRGILAYATLIVFSIALTTMGIPLPRVSEIPVALLASTLVGFGLAAFDIIWVTVLQEIVPNDKLGRVSSIDTFVSFVFMPLGYVLGGVFADRIGPSWVFVVGGVLNFVVIVTALCLRDVRQLE